MSPCPRFLARSLTLEAIHGNPGPAPSLTAAEVGEVGRQLCGLAVQALGSAFVPEQTLLEAHARVVADRGSQVTVTDLEIAWDLVRRALGESCDGRDRSLGSPVMTARVIPALAALTAQVYVELDGPGAAGVLRALDATSTTSPGGP